MYSGWPVHLQFPTRHRLRLGPLGPGKLCSVHCRIHHVRRQQGGSRLLHRPARARQGCMFFVARPLAPLHGGHRWWAAPSCPREIRPASRAAPPARRATSTRDPGGGRPGRSPRRALLCGAAAPARWGVRCSPRGAPRRTLRRRIRRRWARGHGGRRTPGRLYRAPGHRCLLFRPPAEGGERLQFISHVTSHCTDHRLLFVTRSPTWSLGRYPPE
mmetsp:Transcript_79797/g.213288  ORF Transcript_79797/g.213288 Transcript_79797/m.213288 type:complete len:215 (+) Transcript_79797:1317-1961(+)